MSAQNQQHFWIDGEQLSYQLQGETQAGPDKVLLAEDDDLSAGTSWAEAGFVIAPFLPLMTFRDLQKGIETLLVRFLSAQGWKEEAPLSLEKYHEQVADGLHQELIQRLRRCLPIAEFPIEISKVVDRVSEICGKPLQLKNPHDGSEEFCLRIVRPRPHPDNNPPHRDVYLDHLRDAVNIYVPLAGSNALSALPLLPGSHQLNEKLIERTLAGARVDGVQYSVPCITRVGEELRLTRPNPYLNEVMVFSPYLVHGGGWNLNTDLTRISLEMRFWRKRGEESVVSTGRDESVEV